MSDEPWYHGGLRFQCVGCGACCTGEPGYVWINKSEIAAMAAAVGLDVDTFERRFVRRAGVRKSLIELPGGDCVFYDNPRRRCRVYAVRPRQCRSWPFWDSNLRSAETWKATCEICPGSGRGPQHTVDQIESLRGMIHV